MQQAEPSFSHELLSKRLRHRRAKRSCPLSALLEHGWCWPGEWCSHGTFRSRAKRLRTSQSLLSLRLSFSPAEFQHIATSFSALCFQSHKVAASSDIRLLCVFGIRRASDGQQYVRPIKAMILVSNWFRKSEIFDHSTYSWVFRVHAESIFSESCW